MNASENRLTGQQHEQALQRARDLVLEGWHQNSGKLLQALMEEFLPDWTLIEMEVIRPMDRLRSSYRARLRLTDGKEYRNLTGEGDGPYSAVLGALVEAPQEWLDSD